MCMCIYLYHKSIQLIIIISLLFPQHKHTASRRSSLSCCLLLPKEFTNNTIYYYYFINIYIRFVVVSMLIWDLHAYIINIIIMVGNCNNNDNNIHCCWCWCYNNDNICPATTSLPLLSIICFYVQYFCSRCSAIRHTHTHKIMTIIAH